MCLRAPNLETSGLQASDCLVTDIHGEILRDHHLPTVDSKGAYIQKTRYWHPLS